MLTLLEHLNFKVPYDTGEKLIQDFFVNRLGCPECPPGRLKVSPPVKGPISEGTAKQMHVNMGLSQIHFEWCTGDGRPYVSAQRLEGTVTLAVRNMEKLKQNLSDHPFELASDGSVVVVDPFGITTWICVPGSQDLLDVVSSFGEVRAGGVGNIVGLIRVDYKCRPGVSSSIVQFYEKSFGVAVLPQSHGFAFKTRFDQVISFNETEASPPPNAYDVNPQLWGIHMCFYIESYPENSERLKHLFRVNPDYKIPPINDFVSTVPQALERKQFRMKQVGQHYVMEHEVRAKDHPLSPLARHSRL